MLFYFCGSCVSSFIYIFSIVVTLVLCCFFFFQAEDGIRDLVRSRGLGDVYKRQDMSNAHSPFTLEDQLVQFGVKTCPRRAIAFEDDPVRSGVHAVSYTHLTLPTSDLV